MDTNNRDTKITEKNNSFSDNYVDAIRYLELKDSDVHRLGNAIERIIEPSAKYNPDITKQLRSIINSMIKNAYEVKEILKKILDE